MKNKFIFIFFIFIHSILFSNNSVIDSLKNRLNIVTDAEKVEVLIEIAKANLNESPQQSVEFADQAFNLSRKIDYFKGETQAYKLLGTAYHYLNNYDKALEFYQKVIEHLGGKGDTKEIANTLNRIGIVYDELADFNQALLYYMMSLEKYEEIEYKKGIALSQNNIGLVYWNLGNYDKALEYYQRSLKIFEELDNKRHIAHLLNNLGIVYKSLNEQEIALDYYLRSLRIKEQLGDKKGIANSLGNIGIIYKNLGKYDESLKYYLGALEILRENDDKWGIANTLNNIGNLYIKQKKYNQALPYLEQGLELALEIKAKSNVSNSYFFLSELFSAQKDYKKALEYYKLYSAVKDSIFTEKSSHKIVEMQIKYETEKKENENSLLKKDIEISELENTRLILFLLVLMLVLVALLIFLILRIRTNYRLKNTLKELEISKENVEQIHKQLTLINSMLRHDLANDFTVIKTALQMYHENKDERMLKESEIKCDKGLQLINSLRNLEFGSGENSQLKPIDLKELIDKLTPEFSSMKITQKGNCKVLADEAMESVLHNIFENALIHGKATNITIYCEEFTDYNQMKIYNDGKKIPPKVRNHIFEKEYSYGDTARTGMGLFLVRQNINRYGGSIYIEDNDEPGVTYIINLKKA